VTLPRALGTSAEANLFLDFWKILGTALVLALTMSNAFAADSNGKQDFLDNCARCHGASGKGSMPGMRNVPGYKAIDLTTLTRTNGGQFPHQKVYDIIDGSKRFQAHLVGDMPQWGLKFKADGTQTDTQVKARINALVDYIQTLQAP